MKELNTQKKCIFELGTEESTNVPIWMIVGFKERDRYSTQKLNNDTFLDLQ